MDVAALRSALADQSADFHIEHHARCASTMDRVAVLAAEGAPAFTAVFTDTQSAGRGRFGRRWESPAGSSLLLSLLLRPDAAGREDRLPLLTMAAGVAVWEICRRWLAGARTPALMWPNDVVVADRKLAGILIELHGALPRPAVIVGVGININLSPEQMPPELQARVTSLQAELGTAQSREAVGAAVLAALRDRYFAWAQDGGRSAMSVWRQHNAIIGHRVHATSAGHGALAGVAEALDDDGALRIRDEDGRLHRVSAGEVTKATPR